ncbi:stranded at second transmembrane protein isoform X2 [Choristoneura fumiferana]|uniref:stranded at second transmembrane protein isoform X2 n=1 Tax=Choristoneura fumiferana TaxID=7141 RepID=UPI003D15CE4A
MCVRAVALWCALALAAGAAAYTVDCNHEYTDCDTELGKLPGEEEDSPAPTAPRIAIPLNEKATEMPSFQLTTSSTLPTRTTSAEPPSTTENRTEDTTTEETVTETLKPRPRLLNLSVDDLKNFAFALHNQTTVNTKKLTDLSDVTLDGEDEYEPPKVEIPKLEKDMPDKFYTNLQAPFHPILTVDRSDEVREEADLCRENEVSYKIGERIDRACEETCECIAGGIFDCSPRCKHPYIRRGRRINDPLCFESPVDQCCSIIACATDSKVIKLEVCRYGNDTYPVGSKWNVGCEQRCSCEPESVVTCKPRCNPLPQSDKCINVQDPKDACCEVQVCDVSQDVHEEPVENTTSTTSTTTTTSTSTTTTTTITSFSTTEAPLTSNISQEIPRSMRPLVLSEPIGSVKVLQNNSVQVNLMHMNSSKDPINLLLSNDGGRSFKEVELKYDNMILNLDSGKDYILKTRETGTKFNFTITASDPSSKEVKEELIHVTEKIGCHEDGKFYEVGEEFHIGCTELCECTGAERRECAALECPAHVGLELVSKGCVRWAPTPPPRPPNCCPRAARCLSDGTCHYKEVAIPNWTEVPISLTGCEQRCFCENGELDCQEVCTPLSPLPPQSLRCPPLHRPGPVNISDEDCCKQWGCVPNGTPTPEMANSTPTHPLFLPTIPPEIHFPQDDESDYEQNNIHRPMNPLVTGIPGLPPGLTVPLNLGDENKKLTVITLESDSPTSIKMLFGLPAVLVGLRGSVDLRYTDTHDDDITHWQSQVFAPADEVLTTSRLEFRLTGLTPGTLYRLRGKLYLHNLPLEPESEIYTIRTHDVPVVTAVEEKRREINSRLTVLDVNDTVAHVSWRRFTEEELQFIDGIQIRYRPVGTPIYSMTELLHHSRAAATLRELRAGSHYEASLVLVPPPRAATELVDPAVLEFTTAPYVDPYNWSVSIEARTVGSEAAELTWRGIPSPAERWVRVYRASHACGGARREHDAFRLAARDLPPSITLTGLEPDTRCRVWLELFLTNGKVKTSNVLEINTKSLDSPEQIDNAIEASSVGGRGTAPRGDYYGALVVVGVVAALGALTSLLLLLVVVRRHRPRSVPITPVPTAPRESSLPPYDNPAYKLELQQETMDL